MRGWTAAGFRCPSCKLDELEPIKKKTARIMSVLERQEPGKLDFQSSALI